MGSMPWSYGQSKANAARAQLKQRVEDAREPCPKSYQGTECWRPVGHRGPCEGIVDMRMHVMVRWTDAGVFV